MNKFKEHKSLNLPSIDEEILKFWKDNSIFEKSISECEGAEQFVFYEGPPSANGMPGIHHVMARAIKDIFCRYKTLKGYQVKRKGGWDTHGLPVELQVEKKLGITKEDIGKKVSIEEYNIICREEVMKFKSAWDDLTERMGYWVDLEHPYITFENNYIETLWWILKSLFEKDLLYEGYTIQPYSPAAGTGLSSHELNLPGTYREVKDTSCTAMFKVTKEDAVRLFGDVSELKIYSQELIRLGLDHDVWESVYVLAWTTTPWTLPANAALAVGENIEYFLGGTINPYTRKPAYVIIAKDRFINYFPTAEYAAAMSAFHAVSSVGEDNNNAINHATQAVEMAALAESLSKAPIPIKIFKSFKGSVLSGTRYVPLFDDLSIVQEFASNVPQAFQIILGDFVSTEDGTGIVHISPTFGSDDKRVADKYGIKGLYVTVDEYEENSPSLEYTIEEHDFNPERKEKKVRRAILPIVDRQGKYVPQMGIWAGRYVKNYKDDPNYQNLDVDLCVHLKQRGLAFKVEKYEHNYPHCWRTDKPILYYPLDSWFIKTTAVKEKLIELNKTINWKPKSTGEGRFGNWLENLQDWNLSRSRFWGTPLPLWLSEDKSEIKCIGSIMELSEEIEKSVGAGLMKKNSLKDDFDLHRPFVDDIILVSKSGKPMRRVPDLVDVWFDSGAMPYAQWHYPFENKETFQKSFPADYIAEGVDQTRGWFFTLHVLATMLFDSVAFKNVISNGLILDKFGNKMSKRVGNVVDPFKTITENGADATRWYLLSNAQPWDNTKFDIAGIEEVKRKLFGTLFNTYCFFALYANIDGFVYKEAEVPSQKLIELDHWIISLLNSLVKDVEAAYDDYEPTKAARTIETFVDEHLSNWYVRLSRRRFWKGEYSDDKIAAYQTLYKCLNVLSKLMSPIAPFFGDFLYKSLNDITLKEKSPSVHLSSFPKYGEGLINKELEERMQLAQDISSLVLSLRKKVNIRVRQPLNKILIPITNQNVENKIERIKDLILAEVNVKQIEYIKDTSGVVHKKVKPNFKSLGQKLGKKMKLVGPILLELSQAQISELEKSNKIILTIENEPVELVLEDVEILSEDIPGWQVANKNELIVALDVTITNELRNEGNARELVNRIQKLRKDSGFEVTDRINVKIKKQDTINEAISDFKAYICAEILADTLEIEDNLADGVDVEVNEMPVKIIINKKKN